MTLGEFQAWLEGFEASCDGAPNAKQWATIKEKLATVAPLAWRKQDDFVTPPLITHEPRYDLTAPAPIRPGTVTCGIEVERRPDATIVRDEFGRETKLSPHTVSLAFYDGGECYFKMKDGPITWNGATAQIVWPS